MTDTKGAHWEFDAYTPVEIVRLVETVGVRKPSSSGGGSSDSTVPE